MPTRDEFLNTGLEPITNSTEGVHCPICDEDPPVNLIRLPCHENHIYCQPCAVQWLQRRGVNTCPHCRTALFDLPPEELQSEDEEDGEIADEDEDEDGAEAVDLEDEDIWEYEDEDEDDNGSLAGGYYAVDEEEEGDELDEADNGGGEDQGNQGREDTAEEDDESNQALRESILATIRGVRERRLGVGVGHDRLDLELLARVEANREDGDLSDDEDENDNTDGESSSSRHEVQRRRRQLRVESGDLDEQLLAAEEERSRSPPLPTSGDAEQEEEGSARNSAAPATDGSSSGDGELLDQDWETELTRLMSSPNEEEHHYFVISQGFAKGRKNEEDDQDNA